MTATVSVVVPVYNAASTIGVTLDSLLQQSFEDFEVVVVDDGSTDATKDVVEGHSDIRVRVIESDHEGESAARNRGIEAAMGEFVTFLDADDQVFPRWLECLDEGVSSSVDVVRCGGIELNPAGLIRSRIVPGPPSSPTAWTRGFMAATYAVRTSVLKEIGGIEPGLRFGQHADLALRLWPHAESMRSATTEMIGYRRTWSGGDDRYGLARTEWANHYLIEHAALLKDDPSFRAACWATAGVSAARAGEMRAARDAFFRSARAKPSVKTLGRVAMSTVVPVGRRYWHPRPPAVDPGVGASLELVATDPRDRDARSLSLVFNTPQDDGSAASLTALLERLRKKEGALKVDVVISTTEGAPDPVPGPREEGGWRGATLVPIAAGQREADVLNQLVGAARGEFVAIFEGDLPTRQGLESLLSEGACSALVSEGSGRSLPRISALWRDVWVSLGGWQAGSAEPDRELIDRAALAGYTVR